MSRCFTTVCQISFCQPDSFAVLVTSLDDYNDDDDDDEDNAMWGHGWSVALARTYKLQLRHVDEGICFEPLPPLLKILNNFITCQFTM